MTVLPQIGHTLLASSLVVSIGIFNALPSSTQALFTSSKTPLDHEMSGTEKALHGSLSSVGVLISMAFSGLAMDKIGRKWSTVIVSLIFVIAWAMIAVCTRVELILFAMFLSGIASAAFLIVTVYVSEICQESIRGALTAMPIQCYSVGLLVSYAVGGHLDYLPMIYVFLTSSVIMVLGIGFLKETPLFLMTKGLEEEAAKSIAFYRGLHVTSDEVKEEIRNLRRALNPDSDDARTLTNSDEKKPKEFEVSQKKLSQWQFFKQSSSTQRALAVCLVLMTAYIFQGFIVVQVYAEPLFEQAVPTEVLSKNTCSILSAIVALFGGLAAAYLMDRIGRKPLMIVSSIITGLCCLLLATDMQLGWGPKWLTAVLLYVYAVSFTTGAGTVPFVVVTEVFLPEIKSTMSMIVLEWGWAWNFILLFIYNPLVETVGMSTVFYGFAGAGLASAAYCVFYLPETKGLSAEAIQDLFKNKK